MQTQELTDYINQSRNNGITDDAIREKLVTSGWQEATVNQALHGGGDVPVPPPPPPAPQGGAGAASHPADVSIAPVVEKDTSHGVEYRVMFYALLFSALSLGFILHDFVNVLTRPGGSFMVAPFATATFVVTTPIYIYLFIRTKKAEAIDSSLINDPSRKKNIQSAISVSFIIGILHLISYLSIIFSTGMEEVFRQTMHMLVTLSIAGSIFFYYWTQERKK